MPKLSRVSKLDMIRSWSLEAKETCPGAHTSDGLVDACQGCYAIGGNYRFPNVKAPREFNKQDWKRENWVEEVVAALNIDRFFRWFDSGDIYHPKLAEKIKAVIELTPWCQHWLPTRSFKSPRIRRVLEEIKALPNVSVRYSSDSVTGQYEAIHGSTIVPSAEWHDENITVCQAAKTDGKCTNCRACWDAEIPLIGYVAHGRSMIKLVDKRLTE